MFIDTHCHIDTEQFNEDREQIIQNARLANVEYIISLGDDIESSQRCIALAESHDNVFATVGIHPECCMDTTNEDIEIIHQLALSSKKVKAIGEIGLDLHYAEVPIEKQINVCTKQMDIAEELNIPWVIHCRDAESYLLDIIKERDYLNHNYVGVIHCFNNTEHALNIFMESGFYVSIGAYAGYPSARKQLPLFEKVPLNRLMLETDAPYLPPQSKRGQRNEPAYVVETAKLFADMHKMELSEIGHITSENANIVFKLY